MSFLHEIFKHRFNTIDTDSAFSMLHVKQQFARRANASMVLNDRKKSITKIPVTMNVGLGIDH